MPPMRGERTRKPNGMVTMTDTRDEGTDRDALGAAEVKPQPALGAGAGLISSVPQARSR